MDIGKLIKEVDLKVGDLVLPTADEEFLFTLEDGLDYEVDPIEKIWNATPGVVLEIVEFQKPHNYMRVRIMVEQTIGWTYSDYVEIVSCM